MAFFLSSLSMKEKSSKPCTEALGINLLEYTECVFVQEFITGLDAYQKTIYQFFLRKENSQEDIDLIIECDDSKENRLLLKVLKNIPPAKTSRLSFHKNDSLCFHECSLKRDMPELQGVLV